MVIAIVPNTLSSAIYEYSAYTALALGTITI